MWGTLVKWWGEAGLGHPHKLSFPKFGLELEAKMLIVLYMYQWL